MQDNLIARIEAGTGPDRHLDMEIHDVLCDGFDMMPDASEADAGEAFRRLLHQRGFFQHLQGKVDHGLLARGHGVRIAYGGAALASQPYGRGSAAIWWVSRRLADRGSLTQSAALPYTCGVSPPRSLSRLVRASRLTNSAACCGTPGP